VAESCGPLILTVGRCSRLLLIHAVGKLKEPAYQHPVRWLRQAVPSRAVYGPIRARCLCLLDRACLPRRRLAHRSSPVGRLPAPLCLPIIMWFWLILSPLSLERGCLRVKNQVAQNAKLGTRETLRAST
jgi:hypothetical protein